MHCKQDTQWQATDSKSDSSGCIELMFHHDGDAVDDHGCPKHGHDYSPHCHSCENHKFMVAKRQHEIAEQTALEMSLDNSRMIRVGPVGPCMHCSKHGEDFKDYCPTCRKICDLNDGMF